MKAKMLALRAQLPEVPARQVLGEPAPLGTAAALGLGLAWLRARDPGATMAVLSADHQIAPAEALQADLGQAADEDPHAHDHGVQGEEARVVQVEEDGGHAEPEEAETEATRLRHAGPAGGRPTQVRWGG